MYRYISALGSTDVLYCTVFMICTFGTVWQPGNNAEQEIYFFPESRLRLRIWSRETGSVFPPRVSPLFLHIVNLVLELTHRILPNFRDHLYHQPPSGHFEVYQVTRLRTDRVHSRESTGTGLVVLDVVPVTGDASSIVAIMSQFLCCLSFPTPTTHLDLLSIPY